MAGKTRNKVLFYFCSLKLKWLNFGSIKIEPIPIWLRLQRLPNIYKARTAIPPKIMSLIYHREFENIVILKDNMSIFVISSMINSGSEWHINSYWRTLPKAQTKFVLIRSRGTSEMPIQLAWVEIQVKYVPYFSSNWLRSIDQS